MATKKTAPKKTPAKKPAATKPGPTYASKAPALASSQFWERPDDASAVQVWADALVEEGDVRGEFIQLCTLNQRTPEQDARLVTMQKKLGGQLVGPARPFLRTWRFGKFGLVDSITTEAKLFVPGFEAIAQLHPRLQASVTALRTKPLIAAVSTLPLARLHWLQLEWTGMSDATLALLAPALEGVVNLSLAFNDVTQEGLLVFAPFATSLESLALGTSLAQRDAGDRIGAGWIDVLTSHAAFANLRCVTIYNYHSRPTEAQLDRLRAMPKMKYVGVGSPFTQLSQLEQAKAGALDGRAHSR